MYDNFSKQDRQYRTYAYEEPTWPGRHVVVWSGGFDSTLVLAEVARRYSTTGTVIAVVVQSAFLHEWQAKMEARSREAFLKFADSRGWKIHVVEVRMESTQSGVEWTVHSVLGQASLWFHAVVPFLCSNDKVYWGYIMKDAYWLVRDRMVRAMQACTEASFISGVTFEYPLACAEKRDVVFGLKALGVPSKALWTCDNPRPDPRDKEVSKPCGTCDKCKSLRDATAVQRVKHLSGSRKIGVASLIPLTDKTLLLKGSKPRKKR